MPSLPTWPDGPGPRILTLVGNDITIDVRARKTASSLARSGYSVIAIGVDHKGTAQPTEFLDGALIYRVVPSLDPRVSPRFLRLSRPEIRDRLRYRVEIRRLRLQLLRRNLTAWRHWNRRHVSVFGVALSRAWEAAAATLRVPDRYQEGIARKIRNRVSRYSFEVRLRAKRARVVAAQIRYISANNAFKLAAQPSGAFRRRGSWRRDLPELHRYEAAMGPLVDFLGPDLIHVHDVFHLGLAVRAAARAAEAERTVRIVYDAHEYVAGLPVDPRRRAAYTDLEGEYIQRVDAIVTVSEAMAAAIHKRYGLLGEVVMNTPDLDTVTPAKPLRDVVGLSPSDHLVVYVGGLAPHRGAEQLIEGVALLPPNIHLVFVAGPITGYTTDLGDLASTLAIAERVHFAPFVVPEAVVPYIASADVSVIPLSREVFNYEVTLPNKLFQSIHAGVPVVVSDNPAMADFVRLHRVGEVFHGGNPAAMAKAIQTVLDNPHDYQGGLHNRHFLDTLTWKQQVTQLLAVYLSLEVGARE